MNVIIANKRKDELSNINVEVIKRLDGEFEVEEIINTFQNFFYNKMILDITALKNYKDLKTIQQLSISLDMDKLILLLDESDNTMPMARYLSKLISLGIYNFTTNVEGIMYLYNNPNTYKDVAQYHQLDEPEPEVKTIIQTVPGAVPTTIYKEIKKTIIGIKNVTNEAGATTLTYMMKKVLEQYCSVAAIEVDKRDFGYFKDGNLISTTTTQIGSAINSNSDKNVIIIDTNNSQIAEGFCTEILYLLEPSIIKLNKLVINRPTTLQSLKGKKVILNKCALDSKDIRDFSYESGLDIFDSIPYIDDRKNNQEIEELLRKLNLI